VPILDTKNNIVEFIASRYEVTELVEQKNKAIQAEIIKDNFLAHMSHELRTPLNAMIGFNSLALSKTKEPVTKKMLETSLKSSNILLEIINKILDLVKIKNNQCQLKTIPFHLRSNLESIAMMYEHECNEKHILFESYIDPSCTRVVEGDWIRISQIINNLLSNALKFTPKNKSVSFQCYFEKNIFVATISDTGIGISKEFQKEIFNEFSQVDTSTTKQFGGMGLGLSISSALAKMMGATLTCESDLGVGSSFTFKVPLETVKENSPDEKKSLFDDPSFTPLKGKVLVAEDNRTNQMLISILLEEMGLECTIVDNGSDAVETYLRVGGAYDLILLDQDMPLMDGITAMEQIRKRATKVAPIIALTSNNMTGDKEKFLEAGMDDFISKPVDEFELYNIIKKHLLQDA
jgi:CheY-like chemotaxis protein